MRRLFLAGSERVLDHRAELDRINVFPVPDGDTGTNLALTVRAMADAVASLEERSIARVATRLAEAGIESARGNSGMMLSHFFLGFAQGLGDRTRARSHDVARALRHAVRSLYQAVEDPVEGTLLTVIREASEEIQELGQNGWDLKVVAERLLAASRESLARTPELLPRLREAGVVDAGAKGFVRFLEGVVALIQGRSRGEAGFLSESAASLEAAGASEFSGSSGDSYRYCAEFLIRSESPPSREALATAVRTMGDSLIVTRADRLAKIHIHTDAPDDVRTALTRVAGAVERVKVQDMRARHDQRRRRLVRRTAIVTDTTCDLPTELLIENGITVVPLTVSFGDETFLDQIELSHQGFLERLTDPNQPHPTTSQPAPADLQRAYARALEDGDAVLGVFLAGALSGTFRQAKNAADRSPGEITVYDSRSASLGLGFRVLRAGELAADGASVNEIVAELDRLRPRSALFCTLDTLDYVRRSGRIGRAKAFLAGLLDLKPIVSLDDEGVLIPVDRVRGRDALIDRVTGLLEERIPRPYQRLRLGVVHVLCEDMAGMLSRRLAEHFEPDQLMVRPATGVLAAHAGPGAWAVVFQAE